MWHNYPFSQRAVEVEDFFGGEGGGAAGGGRFRGQNLKMGPLGNIGRSS